MVAQKGYKNVMVFVDGIPGWVQAGYPLVTDKALPKAEVPSLTPQQLNEKLANVHVVDIRLPSLYETGMIKGSQKIPLGDLSQRFGDIPKGKEVVLVDHAGQQVLVGGLFLKSKGYGQVSRLQGGLRAWTDAKLPLEK